tara:strand:- start:1325 stop:1780 length:456 start_codon:yes stop_codon:yes gene_type:complete
MHSYKTAMARKKPSLPTRYLYKKGLVIGPVVDYGCGKGFDTKYLKSVGIETVGYDPYWNPKKIDNKNFYNTIICNYVLNVVEEKYQRNILESINSLLSNEGNAYIAVRRDVKKDGPTSRGFQRNVILDLETVHKKSGAYHIYLMKKNNLPS